MNMFGAAQNQQMQQIRMAQAEMELEMMTDTFNHILWTCHKKCIPPKYHEGDLNKGEAVCIDRCVVKYMTSFQKIGKLMNDMGQQRMQQEQQQ
ncbi:hypothetical protein MIR68_012392 [Amoeboaphelidium protococcarum]|nr:hypothetical protein MIR68_012392 [Amoeboaphelidium protococcarum]